MWNLQHLSQLNKGHLKQWGAAFYLPLGKVKHNTLTVCSAREDVGEQAQLKLLVEI